MSISISLIPVFVSRGRDHHMRAWPSGLKSHIRGKSGYLGFKVYNNCCEGFFRWIFGNAYRIKDADGKIWYINKRSLKNWISVTLGENHKTLNAKKIDAIFKKIIAKPPADKSHHQRRVTWGNKNGELETILGEDSVESQDPLGSRYKRKYPPLSPIDTIRNGVSIHGQGGKGLCYEDEDILEVHPPSRENGYCLGDNIYFDIIEGRSVIQQQAIRGCTAGVAAMLIHDNGGKVNTHCLVYTNVGNNDYIRSMMEEGGISPRTSEITDDNRLLALKKHLLSHGPAIVSVNAIGGHVIIVDEISEDLTKIRIRDPFHGWMITISAEAFLKSWLGGEIIQAANPKAIRA